MPPRVATASSRHIGTLRVTERVGAYAELSKFGIVLLVLVSAGAGFMLRAPLGPEFAWAQGLLMLAGVMLLSCGASALNQVQERRRDALMARTAGRPLPSGRLSRVQGLAFALLAIAGGAGILWLGVGHTAGILGLIASAFYNGVYTPWLKPHSPFAAVPGAIPGSIPPVIGWVAAGGNLADAGAVMLFGILFLWQMPHFYALAWIYREDYLRGGFRMLTAYDPTGARTARQILGYTGALLVVSLLPTALGLTGWIYLAGAAALGTAFLLLGARLAARRSDQRAWRLFFGSVAYLPALLVLMIIDKAPV
jgi:protoheme IX farnesyltransferase